MSIIGSEAWQLSHSLRPDEVRDEIKRWLRFSLTVQPDMQLVVRRDRRNFDVTDTVLSRCEISLAYQKLPKRLRWTIWDVVCRGRAPYEVAIVRGIAADSIRRQVDRGLRQMERCIYERLGNEF